jgi:hypothetical protein
LLLDDLRDGVQEIGLERFGIEDLTDGVVVLGLGMVGRDEDGQVQFLAEHSLSVGLRS